MLKMKAKGLDYETISNITDIHSGNRKIGNWRQKRQKEVVNLNKRECAKTKPAYPVSAVPNVIWFCGLGFLLLFDIGFWHRCAMMPFKVRWTVSTSAHWPNNKYTINEKNYADCHPCLVSITESTSITTTNVATAYAAPTTNPSISASNAVATNMTAALETSTRPQGIGQL